MSESELQNVTPPVLVDDSSNENPEIEDKDHQPSTSSSKPTTPLPDLIEDTATNVGTPMSVILNVSSESEPVPEVEEKPIPPRPSLFVGDIVVKKTSPRQWAYVPSFGSVLKQPLYGNVQDNVPKTFNIRWESNNAVERLRPDQVSVVDRLVTRNTKVENREGVSGVVRDWGVQCSVQIIGTNHVVDKVALKRLNPLSSFIRGQEILYQDWIGVITSVTRNIWFLLDAGMGFFVPVTEKEGFMRADPYWGLGMPCPGIRSKLNTTLMRKAVWVSGPMRFFGKLFPPLNYLYSMSTVTINKAEVFQVEVKWLRPAPFVAKAYPPKPPTILNRKTLKWVTVIGLPSSETLGVGSVRTLKLKPQDSLTNYPSWLGAFQKRYLSGIEGAVPVQSPISATAALRLLATDRVYEVPVKVLSRTSNVEVEWSNGNVEKIPSVKIAKILHRVEDNEFVSGMVVSPTYSPLNPADLYGVVLDSEEFAKVKARKVNVMWILQGNVLEVREESVFNLVPHSMYSMYERGTIVFPRKPGSTPFRAAVVSDLNIAAGKLVLTVTANNSQHEVHPHTVAPLGFRSYWNFFTRAWNLDDIIVPPYQLVTEFGPAPKYVNIAEPSSEVLSYSSSNNDEQLKNAWDEPSFEMLAFAPATHRYYNIVPATNKFGKQFKSMITNEIEIMKKTGSIPEGIWVRCYENRLDLISVLMIGPSETPYEDGIFMFDLQVDGKFPASAPKIHHVSYSYEVNPNMAWDGNFCTSALQWKKQGHEVGDGSYIAHCLKQIQALIFNPEPLLAGPRDFIDINSPNRKQISKFYNEFVVLRVLDSAWNMIHRPVEPWSDLIKSHFASVLPEKLAGYDAWTWSEETSTDGTEIDAIHQPKFPLFPASQGFQEAFAHRVERLKKISPAVVSVIPPRTPTPPSALVTDSTADSESVPVSLEDAKMRLLDPLQEPQTTYNDNTEAVLMNRAKLENPIEELDVSSILVPPKKGHHINPREWDVEKTFATMKMKGKSKSPVPRKGKILTELAAGPSHKVEETASSPSEVSKVEQSQSEEVAKVVDEEEPETNQPRPTSATE